METYFLQQLSPLDGQEGVKMVQKLCTPHNTNAFAMLFAEKIIETLEVLQSLIDKFIEGRNYLVKTLDENGYSHKGEAGISFSLRRRRMRRELLHV